MKKQTQKGNIRPDYCKKVHDLVRRIPKGKVMTYKQIAEFLGENYTPRTVGYAMKLSPPDIPWHRVINSKGGCSTGKLTIPINLQQKLLEQEGIWFNEKGLCDLSKYRWTPKRIPSK